MGLMGPTPQKSWNRGRYLVFGIQGEITKDLIVRISKLWFQMISRQKSGKWHLATWPDRREVNDSWTIYTKKGPGDIPMDIKIWNSEIRVLLRFLPVYRTPDICGDFNFRKSSHKLGRYPAGDFQKKRFLRISQRNSARNQLFCGVVWGARDVLPLV